MIYLTISIACKMDKLEIKEHNFQVAKSKIQNYANSAPKNVTLPKVKETARLFGMIDHRVTGPELNQCMGEVQSSLISLNCTTKAIISEFKNVYNAFEALDKDYISGIVVSVKAAQQASEEAKKANDDITKTIGALKATVDKLQEFKKEVRNDISSLKAKSGLKNNSIKHIDDIDAIWKDVQAQQKLLTDLENQLNDFQTTLSAIDAFKTKLDKVNHIIDIDSMWDKLYKHYKDYEVFYNRFVAFSSDTDVKFKSQKEDYCRLSKEHKQFAESHNKFSHEIDTIIASLTCGIKDLRGYADKLKSLTHLEDIDNMWETLQNHYTAYGAFCQTVHQFEIATSDIIAQHNIEISDLQSGYNDFHSAYQTYCEKSKTEFTRIRLDISLLNQYADNLKSFKHLEDIDKLWLDIEDLKQKYSDLKKNFEEFDEKTTKIIDEIIADVSILKSYKAQLEGLKYLPQIDELWDFTHSLSGRTDVISEAVDRHGNEIQAINSNVSDLDRRFVNKSEELSHRVRVNHIIAASTLVLVLTLFILNILGIL